MNGQSQAQLIQDLSSPSANEVVEALGTLEYKYPLGTNAFPVIRKLLADPRIRVRRNAARALGVFHAPVDQTDIDNICELLKSSDTDVLIDGLKSLRGLKAPQAVPQILPFLKSPDSNIKRDTCRTLAVLGNKDLIPEIQPLLKDSDPKVQQDAMDAIFALRTKH